MDDTEYLSLSLLSQAGYCLRRAALIMNEQLWLENAETAKGRAEHERVHTRRVEHRGDSLKIFENLVYSDQMMITGMCDCIEAERWEAGCVIPAAEFPVRLKPVEFKHGAVRDESEYKIQLCAQAMCLEEMYGTHIDAGALFFITAHRRLEVAFDDALRKQVRDTADRLWRVRRELSIPEAEYGAKCKKCSINVLCMPAVPRSAGKYCAELARDAMEEKP